MDRAGPVPALTTPASAARSLLADPAVTTAHMRDYLTSHLERYATLIALLDDLPAPVGARCLEIGCAEGALSALVRQRYGWSPVGLDFVADAVAKLALRDIPGRVGDIDRAPLPFADASFDVVLFDAVLEHAYHPAHVLRELTRVLEPGGFLVLGTPNATHLYARLRAVLGHNPFGPFNQFNAVEDQCYMRECAVLYTPAEVIAALGDRYDVGPPRYTLVFASGRARRGMVRNLVSVARRAICRMRPRLSDYFYVVARKLMDREGHGPSRS